MKEHNYAFQNADTRPRGRKSLTSEYAFLLDNKKYLPNSTNKSLSGLKFEVSSF